MLLLTLRRMLNASRFSFALRWLSFVSGGSFCRTLSVLNEGVRPCPAKTFCRTLSVLNEGDRPCYHPLVVRRQKAYDRKRGRPRGGARTGIETTEGRRNPLRGTLKAALEKRRMTCTADSIVAYLLLHVRTCKFCYLSTVTFYYLSARLVALSTFCPRAVL